jgi:tRNA pseudouridine38-40 synthase
MVRALVATMLKVGRQRISLEQLASCFSHDNSFVDFSAPAHGLFLVSVDYPAGTFPIVGVDTSGSIS